MLGCCRRGQFRSAGNLIKLGVGGFLPCTVLRQTTLRRLQSRLTVQLFLDIASITPDCLVDKIICGISYSPMSSLAAVKCNRTESSSMVSRPRGQILQDSHSQYQPAAATSRNRTTTCSSHENFRCESLVFRPRAHGRAAVKKERSKSHATKTEERGAQKTHRSFGSSSLTIERGPVVPNRQNAGCVGGRLPARIPASTLSCTASPSFLSFRYPTTECLPGLQLQ